MSEVSAIIGGPQEEIDDWSLTIIGVVTGAAPDAQIGFSVNDEPFSSPRLDESRHRAASGRAVHLCRVNMLDVLRPDRRPPTDELVVVLTVNARETARRHFPITPRMRTSIPEQLELQLQSHNWCLARLRCPLCAAKRTRLRLARGSIVCDECRATFLQQGGAISMLPPELRKQSNLTPSENISSNPYEMLAIELIKRTVSAGGWVLDCGAGSRPCRMQQVVNVEVNDYFSTDILATGEALPIEDNVFDAAVSLAVLEHVRDPFACARELVRVVKPGGEIICSVPFLQALHGYPNHYYNMTRAGLAGLFAGNEIVECVTPPNGHPIFFMQNVLRSYVNGLPIEAGKRLARMTFDELLALDPLDILKSELGRLDPVTLETIACLNTIRIKKLS